MILILDKEQSLVGLDGAQTQGKYEKSTKYKWSYQGISKMSTYQEPSQA